jgi:hypothetical protein
LHNAQIIWNVELRSQVFRFINILTERSAVQYYSSPAVIKAIRDMSRKIIRSHEKQAQSDTLVDPLLTEVGEQNNEFSPDDLIRQLLGDEDGDGSKGGTNISYADQDGNISDKDAPDYTVPSDYRVDNNHLVVFVYPQLSFQSGTDNSTLAFLTAEQIQLESLSILDPTVSDDATNELVKTRSIVHIKDLQVFVAHRIHFAARSRPSLAFRYGSQDNIPDGRWQDWLPIEVLIDYDGEPSPFQRIVQRASATLYYDKRNPLRISLERQAMSGSLGGGADGGDDNITDMIFIHIPSFVFIADALQFSSVWSVATDLLAYREPNEHAEQVNNILLASEANDYDAIIATVLEMQEKIRALDEMLQQFLVGRVNRPDSYIDEYWELLEQRRSMHEELYVIVATITRSQSLRERQRSTTKTYIKAVMTADHVAWLMVDNDSKEPLCECTLQHANLVWIMGDDQSSSNTLEIDYLSVIDRMPNAPFAELLYPLLPDSGRPIDFSRRKMLRVHWRELAPVAGITVVEHFEVNLFPCVVRLTQEVGHRMIAYAFPEKQRLRLHQENMLHNGKYGEESSNGLTVPNRIGASTSTPDLSSTLTEPPEELSVDTEREPRLRRKPSTLTIDDDAPRRRSRSMTRSTTRSSSFIGNDEQYQSLTLMRNRASENRTFIYVKIPRTQLCLSYRVRALV